MGSVSMTACHRVPPARCLVALLVALAAGALAPPPAAAATTTRVDQTYEIVATLDVAGARLDAGQTLTLTNRGPRAIDHVNLSAIPRALGYLTLGGVSVHGERVTPEWTTTTNLRVPLPEPLARDDTAIIRLDFALAVGQSPETFGARTSAHAGVLSFGMWFPILSRVHDVYGLGDPQVSFTADRIRLDLTTTTPLGRDAVACPGLVTAPDATGTHWVCESENVRDFSFVVNPAFRLTTREAGGVAIRVYTQTVGGDLTADMAAAALTGMEETFGEYPWPDLVLAEVGVGGGFSMEYPRAIHLTREKVTDPYVINHEVAHQWFYAQVGNHQMREPWLDEAFADFSARYLMGIGEDQCSPRDVDSPVFAWPAGPTTGGDWTSCEGYFHTVFYKGTEFITAVRAAMGDGSFFEAMRAHIEARQHHETTTRGLLDHLDRWTDADLRPIYVQYLSTYDQATPAAEPGQAKGTGSGS